MVLGVLSSFVLITYRPLTSAPTALGLLLTIAAVAGSVVALNLLSTRLPHHRPWPAVAQALDVVAVVGLALALDGPLTNEAWALLVIPVVSSSVRLGATTSIVSWAVGCATYLGAVGVGVVDGPDGSAIYARIPGVLLAVAITVGLLARWMREGWEIQNELTSAAAVREHRLDVIEQTGRALHHLDADGALEVCISQLVALGFDAATAHDAGEHHARLTVGRSEIVAVLSAAVAPPAGEAVATTWHDERNVRVHSVSITEPQAGVIVTGWSLEHVGTEQVQAMARLVAQTSVAIETSTLLIALRRTASRDPLTGLANRGTFDQELVTRVADPGQIALAFIDVDDFKLINDSHGHQAGDQALVAIAGRLQSIVERHGGSLARYGGDEFVALFPAMGAREVAVLANQMLATTDDPIAYGDVQMVVRLSIGVAGANGPIAAAELMRAGDKALYEAKRAGRARVETAIMQTLTPTV